MQTLAKSSVDDPLRAEERPLNIHIDTEKGTSSHERPHNEDDYGPHIELPLNCKYLTLILVNETDPVSYK